MQHGSMWASNAVPPPHRDVSEEDVGLVHARLQLLVSLPLVPRAQLAVHKLGNQLSRSACKSSTDTLLMKDFANQSIWHRSWQA